MATGTQANPRWGWGWQFWTPIAVIVIVAAVSTAFLQGWWPWLLGGAAIAAGAAVVLYGAWWVWWQLPKRQVDRFRFPVGDPKARADAEDNFRKTISQVFAGAAVLSAPASPMCNSRSSSRLPTTCLSATRSPKVLSF